MAASWTQADVTALEEAIALGATKVKYADKEVQYRSLAEMMALRRRMAAELVGVRTSRRRVGVVTRGF